MYCSKTTHASDDCPIKLAAEEGSEAEISDDDPVHEDDALHEPAAVAPSSEDAGDAEGAEDESDREEAELQAAPPKAAAAPAPLQHEHVVRRNPGREASFSPEVQVGLLSAAIVCAQSVLQTNILHLLRKACRCLVLQHLLLAGLSNADASVINLICYNSYQAQRPGVYYRAAVLPHSIAILAFGKAKNQCWHPHDIPSTQSSYGVCAGSVPTSPRTDGEPFPPVDKP